MSLGSQISFADRWFLYLMLSNFSLRSTTRAYPPEHYSCFFSTILIFDVARTLVLLLLYKEFPDALWLKNKAYINKTIVPIY